MRTYATLLAAALNVLACQAGRGTVIIDEDTGAYDTEVLRDTDVLEDTDVLGDTAAYDTAEDPSGRGDEITLTGDIIVSSQRELDFIDGVQRINGSLTVRYANSLRPLRNLRVVTGLLEVRDFVPATLQHLESLSQVGTLVLHGGDNLLNVEGLSNLSDVESLTVANCALITSLDGLENVRSAMTGAVLALNPMLEDVTALRPLDITDEIRVLSNPSLCEDDVSDAFSYITGDLIASDNDEDCL